MNTSAQNTGVNDRIVDLEEKVNDLEVKLIAQEHRIIPAIKNLFESLVYPKKDPRKVAALNAFLWRVLFSPKTVAVAGGLLGLASLVFLGWQNLIIKDQNGLIETQNDRLLQQIQNQQKQIDQSNSFNHLNTLIKSLTILNDSTQSSIMRSVAFSQVVEYVNYKYPPTPDSLNPTRNSVSVRAIMFKKLTENAYCSNLSCTDLDLRQTAYPGNIKSNGFTGSIFQKCNFSNCILDYADINNASFYSCNFDSTRLVSNRPTLPSQSFFIGSSFVNSSFNVSAPVNLSFEYCMMNFTTIALYNPKFDFDFFGCDLQYSEFIYHTQLDSIYWEEDNNYWNDRLFLKGGYRCDDSVKLSRKKQWPSIKIRESNIYEVKPEILRNEMMLQNHKNSCIWENFMNKNGFEN